MTHRLRKTLYLLFLLYYNGCNLGTAKWKKCMEQDIGDEAGASMPSLGMLPSQHLHVFHHLVALQNLCLGILLRFHESCLIKRVDAPLILITQEILRVLGAMCQELETKSVYLYFIMLQPYTEMWNKSRLGRKSCVQYWPYYI